MTILYNDFLFLKSEKTAGSSIEYAIIEALNDTKKEFAYSTAHEVEKLNLELNYRNLLINIGGKEKKISINNKYIKKIINKLYRVNMLKNRMITEHMPAESLKKLLGEEKWDSLFKVTSIRNPWDILTSYYRWNISGRNGMGSPLEGEDISFEEFLNIVIFRQGEKDIVKKMKPAKVLLYPYVYIDGNLACDYHIRMESIEEDFNSLVLNKLDLGNAKLPHHKSTKKKVHPKRNSYRDYYNKKTKMVVAEYFDKYINDFDYEF